MLKSKIMAIGITLISSFFILYQSADAKFINIYLPRPGGNNLKAGDEVNLAKFDIIELQKFHYDDIAGDTWGAIKGINPDIEIFLYAHTVTLGPYQDSYKNIYLTSFGRYEVDRGHSMGTVDGNNPNFFLMSKEGARVKWAYPTETRYWLDFGNSYFHKYAIEAIVTDYVSQPWTTDGIISDYLFATEIGTDLTPIKYNTDELWSVAMNEWVEALTIGLKGKGQKLACNRGQTRYSSGAAAWLALDAGENPPYAVEEETAFATRSGPGDIQQFNEAQWKRQIDILSAMSNSKVLFKTSTDLKPGENGIDYWGKSFSFWDGLWYTLGSYLIGKNDKKNNSYFTYTWGTTSEVNKYYDEYDKIDLGGAVTGYNITIYNGNNIYWREFEKGYVYVNPTLNDVTKISLQELCREKTHDNLWKDLSSLQNIYTIDLKSHRAAILYKSNNLALFNAPNNLRVIVK